MLTRTLAIAAVSMLSLSTAECEDRWQTGTGFLSVEKPDQDAYKPAKPIAPPQLARWRSPSGAMEFAVELVPPLPQGTPSFAQMERAYSMKGTSVTRRPIRKIGKYDVWTLETLNDDVQQLIAIIHHHKWFHRLRVSGLATTFDMDSAEAFVKSVKIADGEWAAPHGNPQFKQE